MKKFFLLFILSLIISSHLYSQNGYKWVLKPSGTSNNLYGAYINNMNKGFVCGANGTFLVSDEGLNIWTPKSTGFNVNLYSVTKALPIYNSVMCCGDNGTILYTSNAGTNWTQMNPPTTVRLNCIKGDSIIYAVGNNGKAFSSAWNGSNYTPFVQLNTGTTKNLNSVYSLSNFVYACGDDGLIITSTNYGINWMNYTSPTTQKLNYIYGMFYEMTICGNNGVYYSTTNYGSNWINYPTGVSNNLNNMISEYLFGTNGTILYNKYNSIGQTNWIKIPNSYSADLYCSQYAQIPNAIFVFGSNGTILNREYDTSNMLLNINANNINTYMSHKGIFDNFVLTNYTPGLEWPKGSNKHLVFASGLSASCVINGQLAQTMCSSKGEYLPGAITNGQVNDSSIFKLYKVSRTENPPGADWMNWGCMVPYGAPYVDVNHNGIYEPLIDTPGVKNAAQTIFVCLTDYNPGSHDKYENFGGGIISPLMGIELHVTKWSYTYSSLNDVVFSKFEIVNKGTNSWNKTHFAIVSDIDVGNSADDWVGCDTIRNMGYGYNGTNYDNEYGTAPPAIGFDILKGPVNKRVVPNIIYNMTSFIRFLNSSENPPANESDPTEEPNGAYLFMQGYKKDSAVWLDRTQPTLWGSYKKTKKVFYGDPETNEGWTAAKGFISNLATDTIGTQLNENANDKRFVVGMGADNYTVNSGDTAVIWLAQLAARGTSNLNSVTKLKQLSDVVQTFFDNNFTIDINKISSEIPVYFTLSQNYPNPFNPVTKIKYSIAQSADVKLVVYDILGRKVTELVNEKQSPGIYEVLFDASSEKLHSLASGVYFYKLTTGNFTDTKRMLMIK